MQTEFEKENNYIIKNYRQERGNWVQVLNNTKEIDEVLLGQIIGEVAKAYESDE